MKKLVRDRIPEIIKENGEHPVIRTLKVREMKEELKKKLSEEAAEFSKAGTKKEMIEELADIQEVMLAIYKEFKISCSDVTTYARKKRKERGAFVKRIYLEGTK